MSEENCVRMTCQRCAILEAVKKSETHPTADEIFDKVRQKL
ncbi:MAG: transcriptional repressor, partial [Candidatus Coatesbacteria bacterium]|nr:transcriptional repressor [Candidatus Coatesbacteria bacterium]